MGGGADDITPIMCARICACVCACARAQYWWGVLPAAADELPALLLLGEGVVDVLLDDGQVRLRRARMSDSDE